MAAKLATVDDRILAGAEDACGIFDGRMVSRISSDKPKVGGMHFDCGYLSPFFVTDPEREFGRGAKNPLSQSNLALQCFGSERRNVA